MSDDDADDDADRRAGPRAKHPRRIILRGLRQGPRTGTDLARSRRVPLSDLVHAFAWAEADGLVTLTDTGAWALTSAGVAAHDREAQRFAAVTQRTITESTTTQRETTTMKRRKSTAKFTFPATTDPVLSAADIEAERDRLRELFHGPGHVARQAIGEDPVLVERLDKATADGLVIDLANVPRFRRGAEVERLLVEFEQAVSGGPCAWCGTVKPRRGRQVVGYRPGAHDTEPGWSMPWNGLPCCAWCRDVIGERGEVGLRGLVFRAAASIKSPTMADRWELDQWVVWWHDLEPSKQNDATRNAQADGGVRGPWAHVPVHDCRALASDLLLVSGALSGFVTTPGGVEHSSIPGLRCEPWTPADLPKPRKRIEARISGPYAAAMHAQTVAWAKRRAEAKARRAATETKRLAALREQDARLEAMTPDERAAWEQRTAAYVPSVMARETERARAAAEVEAMQDSRVSR